MIQVYTDKSCSFCRWLEERVKRFDRRGRLEFLDYNDPTISNSLPFSREQLAAQMHVRGADGAWSKGFFGWLAVLRALPTLAWLGWLLALPPLRWLGPPFYRFVARRRYSLPGAPPRCDTYCSRHMSVLAVLAAALLLPLAASAQDSHRAAQLWKAALAGHANNPAALAGLAVCLREREPDTALEYARRAVELSNWEAVGPIRILALVHRARGEPERAREVLRKAVVKFPDHPLLEPALARLAAVEAHDPGRAELPLNRIRLFALVAP